MSYPTLVYKCPGDHQCPRGTFSYKAIENEAELVAAKESGWFLNLMDAVEGKELVVESAEEVEPPTREELEQKAKELDIKFDGRTTDSALARKIESELD